MDFGPAFKAAFIAIGVAILVVGALIGWVITNIPWFGSF